MLIKVVPAVSFLDEMRWLLGRRDQRQYMKGIIDPGGRLNKKDGLTRYGDSHVKDKTS